MFVLAIFLPSAFSLGIAPAQREFKYEMGPQKYVIKIVNTGQKNIDVSLYTEGPLKDYIKFTSKELYIEKQTEIAVEYIVNLPEDLEPGLVQSKIIAEETLSNLDNDKSQVKATLQVSSIIKVNVPYQKKYLKGKLNVIPSNEKVDVNTNLQNLGFTDIDLINAKFDISNNDKIISSKTSQLKNLKKNSFKELEVNFQSKDIKPGLYSAVATIGYDERTLKITKEFSVGKPNILINKFNSNFKQNLVNELVVDVESSWNKEIKDVRPITYIFRNGNEIAVLKAPSFDILPYDKQKIKFYFNTEGLALGEFNAIVTLNYENDISKKEQKINILTPEEYNKQDTNSNFLIYLVAINIIITLLLFIYLAFFRNK